MRLSRLLARARLTTEQALEVGAGVLGEAARTATTGDAGPDRDVVVAEPVVTADGQVVLDADAAGAGTIRRSVHAILTDVVAAAPVAGPADEQRRAELDRALRDLPVAGVPVVARRLQEAAAALDRPVVAAELGALVLAVGAVGGSGRGVASTGRPRRGARAEPVPRTSPGTGSAGRRIGAWLLSLLVLGAVVTAEVVFLRDDITADVALLLDAGREGDRPEDAQTPVDPDVPAPAPAAAGSVAAVDLRPLTACAPGQPCSVRVDVQLVPAAEPQVVSWTYRTIEGCTGPSGTVPGGTVTVPPQADRATAVGVVVLPPLDGVAVVAVTGAPAVAASEPVVIGTCRAAGPDE